METLEYRLYSSLADVPTLSKWAEIDLGALRGNYHAMRNRLGERAPGARLIAVVKADAYGHGASACVASLLLEGCDFFAVSCLEEAIPVRRTCNELGRRADILILGYTAPSMARVLYENDLTQALLSLQYAEELASCAEEGGFCLRAHVAVDTGMNRIGFLAHNEDEISASAKAIQTLSTRQGLEMMGIYTHFARADEVGDVGGRFTRLQIERFQRLCMQLERYGVKIPFRHVSNSAAFLSEAVPCFEGVRIGIALYGAQPDLHRSLPLLPVMRLKARIVHIHALLPGECVSYGGEFSTDTERKIAVIPIGYADGFVRSYGGATVAVQTKKGKRTVPIVGRICMDQCMLDVTDVDAEIGDAVTLFGDVDLPAQSLAQRAGSIDYETLCLISARVIRVIC